VKSSAPVFALVFVGACSSSETPTPTPSDAGGDSSVPPAAGGRACLATVSGANVNCKAYSPAWSDADISKDCTPAGPNGQVRSLVASCPTDGVLATCANASAGGAIPAVDIKYYAGAEATLQANCTGLQGTYRTGN
jgi:hypothetical protein